MYLGIKNRLEKEKRKELEKGGRWPYYADSEVFFARQGEPPIFNSHRPRLDLALLTSVPPFITDFDKALATHIAFKTQVLSNTNVCEVLKKSDLEHTEGSMRVLFGLQHAPNGMTLRRVKKLRAHGIFAMTLAYDGQSEYGCGFASEDDTGLTKKGRALIENMSASEMNLDLSHASHKTAADALEFIQKKKLLVRPMVTHSGSYAVYPHKRNLPDDILKGIAQMGGYIGINLITFLLGAKGSNELGEFVQHVMHVVHICGYGAVGVGSDCPHTDMSRVSAKRNYERLTKLLKTNGKFGERFPDRPEPIYRHGSRMFEILRETLSSGINPDVIDTTGKIYFTPEIVRRVLGLNFKKFVEDSLSD